MKALVFELVSGGEKRIGVFRIEIEPKKPTWYFRIYSFVVTFQFIDPFPGLQDVRNYEIYIF